MAEEEIRDPGTVTFNDVAVYFPFHQWAQLADWQRRLYQNVMKEIHAALTALGYEIANPGILVKVQHSDEPHFSGNTGEEEESAPRVRGSPRGVKKETAEDCQRAARLSLVKPDILLRVKMEETNCDQACQTSAAKTEDEGEDSNTTVFDPELSLWIKQEEEPGPADPNKSSGEEDEVSPDIAPPIPNGPGATDRGRMSPWGADDGRVSLRSRAPSRGSRARLTANKRTGLKLRDKILVLCAYENNEPVASLATQFGVSRSQIVQIIRRREELLCALQNNVSGDRIRRQRRTTNDQVNAAVWEWLQGARDADVALSGRVIREKALQIAREHGIRDFKASNGWLNSFKKAHNIHCYSLPLGTASAGDDRTDFWLPPTNPSADRLPVTPP
ncbi:uncharacterized protein LOC128484206 [Spea bombifrons]|uniref:uncharacterized protein LOC128484206 n=1 Tax=Spea bombifrons TaxID=233779 RepID=UPI00234B29AE|nr:uncharacterized protein LOC128484206 [Spea bombifrons]